uniref:Uncharacterized protein n=1 Tax=Romanomermis culicivorax TaxID=13658 RepID=A0A915KJZ7_ROMCU
MHKGDYLFFYGASPLKSAYDLRPAALFNISNREIRDFAIWNIRLLFIFSKFSLLFFARFLRILDGQFFPIFASQHK